MADELRRLEQLQEQLRLVGRGNTVDEMERFCSAFTQEAARMLHAEGWRRIRKTDGKNVDGMDIDKLVHAQSFNVRDIIVSAGASHARVSWQDAGELRDPSRFIEVKPIEVPAPPPPPPPPPPPADDQQVVELLQELIVARDESNVQLNRIGTALEVIAAVVHSAGKRLGLELTWTGRSK